MSMLNKLKVRILGLPLLFWALLSSCGAQTGMVSSNAYDTMLHNLLDHSVQEISVSALKEMQSAHLLDARAAEEYNVSHINGAIRVGYDDFDFGRVQSFRKSDTLVVYCSVGYRSEKVAEKLLSAGFLHVYNLYGGIFEWKNEGMPVVNPQNKVTEDVHAYDRGWGVWLREGHKVYE